MEQLTNKLKILKNPSKKSARELLKAINKPGYEVSIKNRGEVIIRIDKKNVPLSLNKKRIKDEFTEWLHRTHLLFVCSSAIDRSPCAVSLFENTRYKALYEAKCAGISPLAEIPLNQEMIIWADIIFTMEPEHQRFVLENFSKEIKILNKKVILLDVKNDFKRFDRELEEILREKLRAWL